MLDMKYKSVLFSEEEDGAGDLPRHGERDPGLGRQERGPARLQVKRGKLRIRIRPKKVFYCEYC